MMIYVDTNVLIYAGIEQDINKKELAVELLANYTSAKLLSISLLTVQEYLFTFAKLKIDNKIIDRDTSYYSNHVRHLITKEIFINACQLCSELNFYKNINDVIHLKFAEQHCNKLITFDTDFNKFKKYTEPEIEVLK